MNKGHIQAERAEAICKAMNTGTEQPSVDRPNVERIKASDLVFDKTNPYATPERPFRPVARYELHTRTGPLCIDDEDNRHGVGWRQGPYGFDMEGDAVKWYETHGKDIGPCLVVKVLQWERDCSPFGEDEIERDA